MWRIQFFEIMAQIGPVLVLAYVLESRLDLASPRPPGGRSLQLGGLTLVILGEISALAVTAGVFEPTAWRGLLTGSTFVFGLAYLIVALAEAGSPPPTGLKPSRAMLAASPLLLVGLALFVAAMFQ